MLRKLSTIVFAAMFLLSGLHAQTTSTTEEKARHEAMKKLETMSSEEIGNYYQQYHSRLPLTPEQKAQLQKVAPVKAQKDLLTKGTKTVKFPKDTWYPGEFEEVQAIVMTFPYYHINTAGTKSIIPVTETLGIDKYGAVSSYISVLDLSGQYTRLPEIFADLADAIQKGSAQVWINIANAVDSNTIKQYMTNRGTPLTNYRFFIIKNNSFWYRDCGPVGFYYGDRDSVAYLDLEYYGGRAMDDQMPILLGKATNTPVYTTSLEYEGGNIILDGAHSLFTSSMVYAANMDTLGQYYIENNQLYENLKKALTTKQVEDTLISLFDIWKLHVMPTLVNDGGTGHIDLYATMWDENNFVFTEYPDAMSSQVDYKTVVKNVDDILSMKTMYAKNYRGRNIPLPKKDDGSWYTSGTDFNNYTRTYSNSTFVNNVIIQPIFSNDTSGARQWDLDAIEVMKKEFPGYEIIPIDIRGYETDDDAGFDGSGGAIHCITKQIPAENPLRILHGAQQDKVNTYKGNVYMRALLHNHSGIASSTCYWRKKGTTTFTTLPLTATDSLWVGLKGNEYLATIAKDLIGNDTIEYYISVTSKNGKTRTKPYTAANGGLYEFYLGEDLNQDPPLRTPEIAIANTGITFGAFYPNPTNKLTKLEITNAARLPINVIIVDVSGHVAYKNSFIPGGDNVVFELNTSSFKTGIYTVLFIDKAGNATTKRLVIGK